MFGEITWKELSPELQAKINSGSGTGGTGTGAGLMVVDSVFTKKVVATEDEQTEFEIPFDDFNSLNSHLDIKINSTWVNPERYEIVGSKLILDDGVEIGTKVFFTLFHLAEPTSDGGFIEEVDVAETPQEVIVYDGNIIDEKVGALVTEHNESNEAHADIRDSVNDLANERGYGETKQVPTGTDMNTLTENGLYYVNSYDEQTNLPLEIGYVGYVQVIANNVANCITQISSPSYTSGELYIRNCDYQGNWSEWKRIVTNDTGYMDSAHVDDVNNITRNGKYVLLMDTINKPDTGTDWYVCDATFEKGGTTGHLIATCYAGVNMGKTFTRINLHGTWYDWKEVVTSEAITELSNKMKWKKNDWKTENDAPSTYEGSSTTIFHNSSNEFNGRTQGIVMTRCYNSLLAYQEVTYLSDRTTSKFYRLANRGTDTWTEWKQIVTTSDINNKLFENKNLNQTNIDLTNGNWVAGVSVTTNTGTSTKDGWCNIVQFDSTHFLTQIGTTINANSSLPQTLHMRTKWSGADQFSSWQEVATTQKMTVTPLNGWTEASSTKTTIARVGDVVTISGVLRNASASSSGSIICALPTWARANRYQGGVGFAYNNHTKGAYFTVDTQHNLVVQGAYEANYSYAFSFSYAI